MAYATTLSFAKIRLLVENPASPGTFVKVCGLNQRGLSKTKSMDENEVPDCDDDTKPAAIVRGIRSSDWSINASGVLTAEGWQTLQAFDESGVPWNIKYEEDFPAPLGLKTHSGKAFLSSLERDVSRGQNGTVTFTLQADGPLTTT